MLNPAWEEVAGLSSWIPNQYPKGMQGAAPATIFLSSLSPPPSSCVQTPPLCTSEPQSPSHPSWSLCFTPCPHPVSTLVLPFYLDPSPVTLWVHPLSSPDSPAHCPSAPWTHPDAPVPASMSFVCAPLSQSPTYTVPLKPVPAPAARWASPSTSPISPSKSARPPNPVFLALPCSPPSPKAPFPSGRGALPSPTSPGPPPGPAPQSPAPPKPTRLSRPPRPPRGPDLPRGRLGLGVAGEGPRGGGGRGGGEQRSEQRQDAAAARRGSGRLGGAGAGRPALARPGPAHVGDSRTLRAAGNADEQRRGRGRVRGRGRGTPRVGAGQPGAGQPGARRPWARWSVTGHRDPFLPFGAFFWHLIFHKETGPPRPIRPGSARPRPGRRKGLGWAGWGGRAHLKLCQLSVQLCRQM